VKAIVLGGAECVWRDLAALERMAGRWDGLVIAVNDVGCHWTRHLDHWVSLHPERLVRGDPNHPARWPWVKQRAYNGHPNGFRTWARTTSAHRVTKIDQTLRTWGGGSSGLLAVTVAKEIGVTHLTLCGVPMTKDPHFRESQVHVKGRKWSSADSHWKAWLQVEDKLQGWVKSMSGRTRDLLGEPTAEWLEGVHARV
jgi:hypothetical protein